MEQQVHLDHGDAVGSLGPDPERPRHPLQGRKSLKCEVCGSKQEDDEFMEFFRLVDPSVTVCEYCYEWFKQDPGEMVQALRENRSGSKSFFRRILEKVLDSLGPT